MIVTDQQREDSIAALGNPIIKTPNMDRLVNEGTAFRRAYCPTPVCGPTRGSLSTGVPPHEALQTDNFGGPDMDFADFASLLKSAGYQTYGYGKPYGAFRRTRMEGFDEFLTSADYKKWFKKQGITHADGSRGYGNEYYYIPMIQPYPAEYDRTHWTADRSIEFLKEKRDSDKPFLLCTHWGRPHPCWRIPYPWFYLYRGCEMPHPNRPADFRNYRCRANLFQNRYKWMEEAVEGGDDLLLRRIRAAYYAGISYLDWNMGRIFEALGDEMDNTLIIFTTDHGEMLGDYGCVGKRCMLEASVRVPLIARLPGFMPEGRQVRGAATLLDVMPTICEAAGIETPELSEAVSLTQIADKEPGDRIVFSQFSRSWNGQYFASDGDRAYWYSAADKREWNFRLKDELDQGPILERDQRGEELYDALIQRHEEDLYSDAVEDGDWKDHEVPISPMCSDPDYGYLMTDSSGPLQDDINALGPEYVRQVTGLNKGHLMGEHMVTPTEEEWEAIGYRAPWLEPEGMRGGHT